MATPNQPLPGNFYKFNLLIELEIRGVLETAYPAQCFRDGSSGGVRWGTLTMPEPGVTKASWKDDERNGLNSRRQDTPDSAIGAEGSIGGLRLVFERILQVSPNRNFVVFALYSPEKDIRLAYGFERRIFEPGGSGGSSDDFTH